MISHSTYTGQEIDSSYDSSSDDIIELDDDLDDLEELEELEASSDENVRYLRVGRPERFPNNFPDFPKGPGGFKPPGGGFGKPPGGGLKPPGGNSGQLRVPHRPNMKNMPRGMAPKGWDKARGGKGGGGGGGGKWGGSYHYHGFYLHDWCDCMWGNWFCFCFD